MKKIVLLLSAIFISTFSIAQSVLEIIENSPDHVILEGLIYEAGMDGTLGVDGPYTLFAPTDAAFGNLPSGVLQAMIDDPDGLLVQVLNYHLAGVSLNASNLFDGQQILTLHGASLNVTVNSSGIFVNNALITIEDIFASNGVVHVIDAVLLPPATTNSVFDVIANSPDHTILEQAFIAAQFEESLRLGGPFMVFAPTDAAFSDFPPGVLEALFADPGGELANILTYHLSSEVLNTSSFFNDLKISTAHGDSIHVTITNLGIFIDSAQILVSNIMADNGIVHVISRVLEPTESYGTIKDIITGSTSHVIFESLLDHANLLNNLGNPGPYTVFAPTDAAFNSLPPGMIETLLADQTGALANLLLYHENSSVILSEDLTNGQTISMINGSTVTVTINGQGIFINDAKIITQDIIAENGVVHIIDAVLIPPTAGNTIFDIIANSPTHTILEQAIISAALIPVFEGTGPLTVFAPTNAAFNALPSEVLEDLITDPTGALTQLLLYHSVEGQFLAADMATGLNLVTLQGENVMVTVNAQGIFINNAKITVSDIMADNGVVHVINAVLIPPPPTNSVLDIIKNSPQHTILEFILTSAGFADDLDGHIPYTVFAPTDAAFDALPPGFINELLSDPTGELLDILLYHTLNGSRLSTNMMNGQNIVTLNGAEITVNINGLGIFINDAKITMADIIADNGVVHVIDAVLMIPPPAPVTILDIIVSSPVHTKFEQFILDAGLSQMLSGTNQITIFAPTDAAFNALSPALLAELSNDPTGVLAQVLLYHMINGRVPSSSMTNGTGLMTINTQSVNVTVNMMGIFINNARITIPDVPADNGLVHFVNAVLLPANTLSSEDINSAYPEVKIFPNPANSELNLDLSSIEKPVKEIRILDLQGKIVLNYSNQSAKLLKLDISHLITGLYIVELVVEDQMFNTKLIVKH